MNTNINNKQRLMIVDGANKIAEALSISEKEVFEAIREHGNITSDEEFVLMICDEKCVSPSNYLLSVTHKTMTTEEYNALSITGWHCVCKDIDGFGNVGLIFGDTMYKDSERYKYLRNKNLETIVNGGVFAGIMPDNLVLNNSDLDNEIDDAMDVQQRGDENTVLFITGIGCKIG